MSNNLTMIVSALGIGGVIIVALRSKLSGFLTGFKKSHDANQLNLEKEIEIQKEEIRLKQQEIKDLEEHSKRVEEKINNILTKVNTESEKIIKDSDPGSLINNFHKW